MVPGNPNAITKPRQLARDGDIDHSLYAVKLAAAGQENLLPMG